jgi:phosphatidylglycerophosphatase A
MGKFWLSVFGAGYSPVAPGTCGSAVIAAVFAGLALAGLSPRGLVVAMLLVALHGAVVTIAYGDQAIAELGDKDPKMIVSDEQCGQALTFVCLLWLAGVLSGGRKELLIFALAGFLLFRLFDVTKPPPVRQIEAIRGAWGVLLDDVGAAVYAGAVLTGLWRFGWLKGLWS